MGDGEILGTILITFALFILFFVYLSEINREGFKIRENIRDNKILLPELWKQRWDTLKTIDINRYKKYFRPVSNVNFTREIKKDHIFVSVASYRDSECPLTLESMGSLADHPELLRIVIVQQNALLDTDCLSWCTFSKNKVCKMTKIERMTDTSGRGPTYSRYRAQQYWNGEEYFLQIDSHMRFVKGWDTLLKTQWSLCSDEKAILTNYPCEYQISKAPETNKLRGSLYPEKFEKDGFYRINSKYTKEIRSVPFQSSAWSANFSFSKYTFIQDVPYDPYTPFLFFGEEMDIAIRAYTKGYSFYSPTINILFHLYKREHRNTFWEDKNQRECEILSRFRLYVRFGMVRKDSIPKNIADVIFIDFDKYALGNIRTLKDYEEMSRININDEKKL